MKRVLVLLGVMMLLCQPCVGMEEIWQSVEADGLLDAARQYAPELEVTATPDLNKSLKGLLDTAVSFLPEALKQVVGSSLRLLVIVLLCGIAHSLHVIKVSIGAEIVPKSQRHFRKKQPAVAATVIFHSFIAFFICNIHILFPPFSQLTEFKIIHPKCN